MPLNLTQIQQKSKDLSNKLGLGDTVIVHTFFKNDLEAIWVNDEIDIYPILLGNGKVGIGIGKVVGGGGPGQVAVKPGT